MRRCLVLGNGPSQNDMPEAVFQDHPSYGSNFIRRFTTYYVCLDDHILRNHAADIYGNATLADRAYLPLRLKDERPLAFLYALPNVTLVDRDTKAFAKEEFVSGFNVTYVCLKLAYYAGFDEVWMWGVDHSVAWDHFSLGYHPLTSDPERHLHNMKVMEKHYRIARKVYDAAGKRILNFSNPSALDSIFERGVV